MKAEACHLYMEGLSLRGIAGKFSVSKESVRKWILKFEEAFAKKRLYNWSGPAIFDTFFASEGSYFSP